MTNTFFVSKDLFLNDMKLIVDNDDGTWDWMKRYLKKIRT